MMRGPTQAEDVGHCRIQFDRLCEVLDGQFKFILTGVTSAALHKQLGCGRCRDDGGGQVGVGRIDVPFLFERGGAKRQRLGMLRIEVQCLVEIAAGLSPAILGQMHLGPFHVGRDKFVALADGKREVSLRFSKFACMRTDSAPCEPQNRVPRAVRQSQFDLSQSGTKIFGLQKVQGPIVAGLRMVRIDP